MPVRRHLAALMAGALLAIPAGCGSSEEEGEPLPRDAVAAIDARLDEVQRRYDEGTGNDNRGACEDIEEDSYKAIEDTVDNLPEDVDEDIRDALEASLARLQELTREGCSNIEEKQKPEPETTPTETVPEETVTETVPAETDTQETTTEAPPPKKKDKQNNDNGNGNTQGGTTVPPGNSGGQLAPEAEGG